MSLGALGLGAAPAIGFGERIWRINWGLVLVLSAIAKKEGIDAMPEEVQAEIDEQLARYGNDPKLAESLSSRRGRSYLRMTIRNRKLVDTLMDRALGTDGSAAPAAASASEEAEPEPQPTEQE